jgi:uncharacterized protein involved in exopolysaccharide biosynthesis
MKDNQTNSYNNLEEDSIDIIALLKTVWNGKKIIIKTTAVFFIIGCLVALLSPTVYTSETTFVPQTSDQNSSSTKGLGSLASLAGINLNAEASSSIDNYISPMLYSRITESNEFLITLLNENIIKLNGNQLALKDYLLENKGGFSFIGFIKKYTIGLFKTDNNEVINSEIAERYNFISDEDFSLIKSLRSKFLVETVEKDGYIKVFGYDKDALISTQITTLATKLLQSRIIALRTNKIKAQLIFSKEQYDLKKVEFEKLQNKLAEFKDSNKNISTAKFMAELQKLESEYQLQQNILTNLASEYNNNKIKLNKDTPIFSVLDEVSVPNERSEPKRSLIALIWVFLGVVLSTGYLLVKEPLAELIKNIKEA